MRNPCTATKSSPRSPQLEKACTQQRGPNTATQKKDTGEVRQMSPAPGCWGSPNPGARDIGTPVGRTGQPNVWPNLRLPNRRLPRARIAPSSPEPAPKVSRPATSPLRSRQPPAPGPQTPPTGPRAPCARPRRFCTVLPMAPQTPRTPACVRPARSPLPASWEVDPRGAPTWPSRRGRPHMPTRQARRALP